MVEEVDAYAARVGSSRRAMLPRLVNIGLAGVAAAEGLAREDRIHRENSDIFRAVALAATRRGIAIEALWREIAGEPLTARDSISREFKH